MQTGHASTPAALVWRQSERAPASVEPPLSPARWLRRHGSAAGGRDLEQQLAADLLALSPKLQQVAQYCLQHARHLHLCRIQDVADQCHTQPVTLVRLAKRYGFRGFLDFKMAFLAHTEDDTHDQEAAHTAAGEAGPRAAYQATSATSMATAAAPQRQVPRQPPRAPDSLGAVLNHHARANLAQHQQGLSQLETDWSGESFCQAVTLLKRAQRVWLHHSPAAQAMAHCYADLLRAAGRTVLWIRPPGDAHEPPPTQSLPAYSTMLAHGATAAAATTKIPRSAGLSPQDVLLTLSLACDGAGDFDAVCMAQRMGVPVLALSDQAHGFLAQSADAHLCVVELGMGLRGLSAGLLLAQAIRAA